MTREWTSPDGRMRLINGDCRRYLPINCKCVDAVVTSPPYNLGGFHQMHNGNSAKWKYGEHDDCMDEVEYQEWQEDILELLYDSCNGPLFYSHKNRIVDGKMICPIEWINRTRWIVHQCVVVNKGSGANVDKRRFFPVHENVWVCFKDQKGRINNADSITDVWFVGDQQTNRKDINHPAVMPLSVATKCVKTINGVVLDPFMGSGTTAIACINTGRKFIGIEKDADYFDAAVARIEKAMQQECLPLDTPPAKPQPTAQELF